MPGGQPRKYKCVEDMQVAIDKYFEDCAGKPALDANGNIMTDKQGNPVILGARPLTVTGLALALGFATRLSLIQYQERPEYMNAILRAKTKIEQYAEERLYDRDGVNGAKFSLANNFKGWRERPEPDDKDALERLDNILQSIGGMMKRD